MAQVRLDPRRDAELIALLRARGYDIEDAPQPAAQDRRPPGLTLEDLERLATPRNALLAWLAYYTVRHPSWPWWAALMLLTIAFAVGYALTMPG